MKTVKIAVARHGARADDDPNWVLGTEACLWNPPLSNQGREQASSLGDYAVSLGIRRLAVSPFTRCLQTAAVVASEILEADERREQEQNEGGVAAANNRATSTPRPPPLVIEIDCSLCEVLSRECMGGEDPEGGQPDPTLWAWNRGKGDDGRSADGAAAAASASPPLLPLLLSAAASSSGLPRDLTTVISSSSLPCYPETAQEARSRYFRALSEAAARALVVSVGCGGGGGSVSEGEEKAKNSCSSTTTTASVMAITHGEAVSAAATMASGGKRPFAVPPTGVVVLEATVDDDESDDCGNKDENDCDESDLLASASSSLACAQWELVEAARGVAFE